MQSLGNVLYSVDMVWEADPSGNSRKQCGAKSARCADRNRGAEDRLEIEFGASVGLSKSVIRVHEGGPHNGCLGVQVQPAANGASSEVVRRNRHLDVRGAVVHGVMLGGAQFLVGGPLELGEKPAEGLPPLVLELEPVAIGILEGGGGSAL